MKLMSFLVLTASLFLLSGCEEQEVNAPVYEGSFNPLTCLASSPGCGVDWYISLKRPKYPPSVEIQFNDKTIIDDCDPKSNWSRNVGRMTNEYIISDYAALDGSQKFSMRIFDRKDCFAAKVEVDFEPVQDYSVKSYAGEKQIWIERE